MDAAEFGFPISSSPQDRVLVDGCLRVLDQLELEESGLQKALAQLSYDNDQIRLLMTLPGVGTAGSSLICGPWGLEALQRWSSRRKLPGFESFDPTVCQSLLSWTDHQGR